jgi:putative effector of murein hydrolase LrgA (UPF0299 family)
MIPIIPTGSWALSTLMWLTQNLFYGGWFLGRWIVWLTWPVWASIVGLGALAGFLSPR